MVGSSVTSWSCLWVANSAVISNKLRRACLDDGLELSFHCSQTSSGSAYCDFVLFFIACQICVARAGFSRQRNSPRALTTTFGRLTHVRRLRSDRSSSPDPRGARFANFGRPDFVLAWVAPAFDLSSSARRVAARGKSEEGRLVSLSATVYAGLLDQLLLQAEALLG